MSYCFLDLRRAGLHQRIQLRSEVIASIRRRMTDMGFAEFQTPILTSSSPEGARDYLVPSRLYPGRFYALPQAPQHYNDFYLSGSWPVVLGAAAGRGLDRSCRGATQAPSDRVQDARP